MNKMQPKQPAQPLKAYERPLLYTYGSVRTLTETKFNTPGKVDNNVGFSMFKT